jgi:hypothetical protein
MLKSSVFAVTLMASSAALAAHSSDAVPKFAGIYQVSSQFICGTAISSTAMGTYNFHQHKGEFDLSEMVYGVGTYGREILPGIPYAATANTFSTGTGTGTVVWDMTYNADSKGVVNTATLIEEESPTGVPCVRTVQLFR